ncbi:MAG: TatD family hydrolase, partial [Rikenellaceae bacterium]
MIFADTHTHLYDDKFDTDREQTVNNAIASGVKYLFLPAVDHTSNEALFELVREHKDSCFAMMGYHPTSVNEYVDNYVEMIDNVEKLLKTPPSGIEFCAVGEIGLDLYWSKDFLSEQLYALRRQFELALELDLPVVVHCRDAWPQMLEVLGEYRGRNLRGIMHGFSGSYEDYLNIKDMGDFLFGIGGPITYKKSPQAEVLKYMDLNDIVLETDAPYLTPVPYRGKRNESAT